MRHKPPPWPRIVDRCVAPVVGAPCAVRRSCARTRSGSRAMSRTAIRAGHPWVYREALGPRPLTPEPGTPIDLVDDEGEFVGRGLYDSDSAIALRVFTRNPDVLIDARADPRARRARRSRCASGSSISTSSAACGSINAESDGLPGHRRRALRRLPRRPALHRRGREPARRALRRARGRARRRSRSTSSAATARSAARRRARPAPISCAARPRRSSSRSARTISSSSSTSPRRCRPACSPICARAAAPSASGRRAAAC